MRILYNIGIFIYRWFIVIGAFFSEKIDKLRTGQRAAIDMLKANIDPKYRYIWVHAASLGEFEQGRPLIEKIKEERPEAKILLTFFSPSGYEVRKNYDKADVICYLPMDTPRNAYRFVKHAHLEMALFIKYEFWANYLYWLNRKQIPTYSISAIFRPQQMFFKWYGRWYRGLLGYFNHLFVQDEKSRQLLKKIEITNVTVAGDTRFDRVSDIASKAKDLATIDAFTKNSTTLIAGSSWAKDEEIITEYFNRIPNLKLIIAPHVVSKEHIFEICSKVQRKFVLFSELDEKAAQKADCIIIDSIGLLSSIYRYGQIAYIGGGFGVGIHNVLEAAVFGMPVIFGPNYQRFREACELIELKAGFSVANEAEFNALMNEFMSDKEKLSQAGQNARKYVADNRGATQKILQEILF